jgi:hypothetical protein
MATFRVHERETWDFIQSGVSSLTQKLSDFYRNYGTTRLKRRKLHGSRAKIKKIKLLSLLITLLANKYYLKYFFITQQPSWA